MRQTTFLSCVVVLCVQLSLCLSRACLRGDDRIKKTPLAVSVLSHRDSRTDNLFFDQVRKQGSDLKPIILPRQARDNHREIAQKRPVAFDQSEAAGSAESTLIIDWQMIQRQRGAHDIAMLLATSLSGNKTSLSRHFTKTENLPTQARDRHRGKSQRKRGCFLAVEDRRAHDADILAAYHAELQARSFPSILSTSTTQLSVTLSTNATQLSAM